MKKEKSIVFNFIMNALLTVSSVIFPLISFPYVSRVLQAEGIGKVNLAISVIAYFSIFANLGIPVYGVKACAKVRDDREKLSRTVHELLFISIVMAVLTYIILIPVIFLTAKLRAEKVLYLLTSTTILFSVVSMEWLFKGLEEYTYITVRSIIFKILSVVALFIFVRSQADYVIYGFISVVASGASGILNIFNARKYVDFKPVGNYSLKRHMKPILILFAFACSATVYTNLDNVMLGFMKTDEDVGIYVTAVKIKSILISLITSLGAVVMPRASYYIEQKKTKEFWKLNKEAMHFVIAAAVPVVAYFILFADECIGFIAGSGFAGSVAPMQIIMPTVLFIGMTNIIGMEILVPAGQEKNVLISTTLGAIADFIINMILIPSMGAAGAAIGTVIAEFVVLIYQIAVVRNNLKDLFDVKSLWKIAAAVCVSVAVGFVIKHRGYTLIKSLCYSAVGFFGIYLFVMLIIKDSFVTKYAKLVSGMKIFSGENREKALLFAYVIYVAAYMLSNLWFAAKSSLIANLSVALVLSCLLIMAIVIVLNISDEKYGSRLTIILLLCAAVAAVTTYTTKDVGIFITLIFITAFCFADYKKLLKVSTITHLVFLSIIVILALTGIIENVLYDKARNRYSLGMDWVNTASNFYLYIILTWIVWRNIKASWIECVALFGGAVFLYVETNTKSAFIFSVLGLAAVVIMKIFPKLSEYKKLFGTGLILETIICPLLFNLYAVFGDRESHLYRKIDKLITGRLTLTRMAYKDYGIKPFGQVINWIGGSIDNRLRKDKAYNFVDSSFAHILLTYGIILFIILMIYIIWIELTAIKKKETFLIIAFSLLIIHTTFDPQLLLMGFHPLLIAASYILSEFSGKTKQVCVEQHRRTD